ncbi:hypothetical protein CK203_040261 [Vitis vinifera]|uniref:Uncharacterized protein n=1 Tax=Vitis vinifera TaxID=29760 RepID=A0A438HXH3_VITVI|nr:hypothetical protein CK203_040261 [Vitis vinifera]
MQRAMSLRGLGKDSGRVASEWSRSRLRSSEKKGKLQATIVERKKGISSWIRLGPASLGLFFDCLVLCIKDMRTGKWVRKWKENGRAYSLVRDQNKGVVSSG